MSGERIARGPVRLESLLTSRRHLLAVTGAAAGLAFLGTLPGIQPTAATPRDDVRRNPFTLGIASGDPLPGAVVLWTRLAVDPLATAGGMNARPVDVEWQVAEDERFSTIVRYGTAVARAERAHAVHVDVRGLRPWRHYFYRFRVGRQLSPVGRTRTAPATGAAVTAMTFAFASCQAWWEGHYTAYADLAAHDHDVVFHFGDYIYEYGVGATSGVRGTAVPAEFTREAVTLEDYRARYALYKTDPHLQAAHRSAPWIVTMDDHEVENNWAGMVAEADWTKSPAAARAPTDAFLLRRANAFRAWWEHMPLRVSRRPTSASMVLYRRFQYGTLARFNLLDTRQYRDDQALGDGRTFPQAATADPARSILGDAQEQWLLAGFAERSARWELRAHQTAIAQLDVDPGADVLVSMDSWDGYEASRARVLGGAQRRGVRNLVSIAGDQHRTIASELKPDYRDEAAPSTATEIVGTSITSGHDGHPDDPSGRTLTAANPHVRFTDGRRGYVRCTLTPQLLTSQFRTVDRVSTPHGTVSTLATAVVEDREPRLHVDGS